MRMRKLICYGLAIVAMVFVGAPVSMSITGLQNILAKTKKPITQIHSVKLSSQDKKLRGAVFVFNKQRTFKEGADSAHLQGYVKLRGKKFPASASRIRGRLVVNFASRAVNNRQRMNTITTLESGLGRLKSVPASLTDHSSCAAHHDEHVHTHAVLPLNEGLQNNSAHVATIHTYADVQFYQKYGIATNDYILSMLNTAESIYSSQLGVRFKVVGQTILQTNDDALDPNQMLSNFRSDVSTQSDDVDLKHLFTGRDMTGRVIGIAYIGALCYSPDYAYGVTQDYYNLTANVFAHELGHNFGASHDSTPNTVMYPSVSSSATQFSENSLNNINTFLNSYGSCLSYEYFGPDLTKATLTIKHSKRIVYGRLLDVNSNPLSNQTIVVTINGRQKQYVTNDVGVYRHFIKARRSKRKYSVFATTKGGEKSSKVLKFSV